MRIFETEMEIAMPPITTTTPVEEKIIMPIF
jgi:hypothetical protein